MPSLSCACVPAGGSVVGDCLSVRAGQGADVIGDVAQLACAVDSLSLPARRQALLRCWTRLAVVIHVAFISDNSAILQVGEAAAHGERGRVQVTQEASVRCARILTKELRARPLRHAVCPLCGPFRVLRVVLRLRGAWRGELKDGLECRLGFISETAMELLRGLPMTHSECGCYLGPGQPEFAGLVDGRSFSLVQLAALCGDGLELRELPRVPGIRLGRLGAAAVTAVRIAHSRSRPLRLIREIRQSFVDAGLQNTSILYQNSHFLASNGNCQTLKSSVLAGQGFVE